MAPYTRRVPVAELEPGMYVESLDRPWLETDYPLEGVRIRDREDIDRLREITEHVYISVDEPDESEPEPEQTPAESAGAAQTLLDPEDRRPRSFDAELIQARLIRARAREFVTHLRDDIATGRPIDSGTARELVMHMMSSVARNPDALMWFTNLKNRHEYTALHSMNVCMIAVSLASFIGEPEDDIRELGVGALLHDIGKIKVPLHVLDKPRGLSNDEFALMKRHPEYGVNILERGAKVSDRSLRVVLEHHERLNGRGYPHGLVGNDISHFSQLVAIADVYDAITSNRAYQRGRSPAEAVRVMQSTAGDFNNELLADFVESLGPYPVGSLVELNTGEVGFIMPSAEGDARPVILVVLDHRKRRYYPQRVRDLNRFPQFSILRMLPSGAYGVDVDDYAEAWR